MKKCANCGFESADEATNCPSCSSDTFVSSSPEALGHIISAEEQRFWEKMTFRQFAILLIRLEGILFLPYALDEATYLPAHFSYLHNAITVAGIADERRIIFWTLFRIVWHVAAAIVIIRYADRIASWLIKDTIPRQPSDAK